MEMSILSTLKFDINIPIPYRFLRRFAKVSAFEGRLAAPRHPFCWLHGTVTPIARASGSQLATNWKLCPGPLRRVEGCELSGL